MMVCVALQFADKAGAKGAVSFVLMRKGLEESVFTHIGGQVVLCPIK
jgi:hypothetical protein